MHVFTSGAMRSPGREQHANLGLIKMKIKVMKKKARAITEGSVRSDGLAAGRQQAIKYIMTLSIIG